MFPKNLKYLSSHEWVRVEGDMAFVGITDFAVKQLSDLVFIDLPKVGKVLTASKGFGEIESVKAVSDLNAPVSGTVAEVNKEVAEHPEVLSKDAWGSWLIKVKMSDPGELDELLSDKDYAKVVEEESSH
ncbi:MAG: glycine cleavage system protein GcvH [Planctomycetota bacterium]